jgi:hypothetical protein
MYLDVKTIARAGNGYGVEKDLTSTAGEPLGRMTGDVKRQARRGDR